jgi:PAS domain S-box-containing protein
MKISKGLDKNSESETIKFFISLFQDSPIPKSISSLSTKKFVFVNDAWEQFVGYSKKDAIGKTALDLKLINNEVGESIRKKILEQQAVFHFESSIRQKNGIEKKVLMSYDILTINKEQFVLNTISNPDNLYFHNKHQEKELLKNTEELLTARNFIINSVENMSDGFVALNNDWVYTYVNKRAAKMLGRTPKELIGKHIWTEFPDGVGLPFYHKYYKAAETQRTQYIQEYYPPFDSWFENRIYPSSEGLTIYFTDITEQKKAEVALKESENHIRAILEAEPECIKQLSAKGKLIYMNPAGLAIIEADNLEMVKGKSVINLISPKHQRAFKKLTTDVFKGVSGKLEFEIKGLKGTSRWLETHAVPLKDVEGHIISLLGITRDITNRKNANELLIQKKQELNIIYSSLSQPVFMLEVEPDYKYKFISVNKSFLNTLDITEKDVINKYVQDLIPEPSLSLVLANYKTVLETKTTVQWEETTPYKTGLKTAIVTVNPLINKDGECTHLIGLVYDITDSKNAEMLIIKNEKYLDSIINNIGDPLFVKDDQSRLLLVNDAFCKIFNLKRADMIGKTLAEEVTPQEREDFLRIDKQVLSTGIENINEESLTVSSGKKILISTKKTRYIDDNNNMYLIGTIRDITDRKKAEEEITKYKNHLEELVELRTNQLEKETIKAQSADLMKSAFLATMSHELRTPMNSIIGFTGILLKEFAGPINEEQKKQLSMVKNSGQHLLGLINDILDISKIEAGKLNVTKYPFNYVSILENTIEFLTPQANKKSLKIITEISETKIPLNSDERRVEQVLLNLISNAIKFSNKGTILVKVDIKNGYLTTQIIDQGIGISKDDLNKLFMPFIQLDGGLKRSHEGTGLGLAICKSLIEKLGGTIDVKSKLGEGSNFKFKLPLEQAYN